LDLFFSDLGPGLITGCADDDPSGISTYSIAGAAFGGVPAYQFIRDDRGVATHVVESRVSGDKKYERQK
jgi:hypothetical protein